jgi:DNA repair protein RecO (recombination protein O)
VEALSEPAIVIAAAAPGERDRLVTFLTQAQGAVKLYARRPRRGQPGALFIEPLQGGELSFSRPREGARAKLVSFVPQRVWPGVRADLGRLLHAQAFLELVTLFATEGEPQPELFALLVAFLNRLETEARPGLARIAAALQLLQAGGFAPSLDACVGCRAPVSAGTGVLLSPDAGGVLCRACLGGRHDATIPVTPGAHGLMVRALTLPPAQARRLRVGAAVEREVARLLDAFVEARTGVRPRCGAYLEALAAG